MQNIKRFIQSEEYFEDFFRGENFPEGEDFGGESYYCFSIKENPELYINIWSGFICDIFGEPKTDGIYWSGLTRDYHEIVRICDSNGYEIENLNEYITDLLRYKDVEFEFEYTRGAYELILDFLTFARDNNLTVMAEYD